MALAGPGRLEWLCIRTSAPSWRALKNLDFSRRSVRGPTTSTVDGEGWLSCRHDVGTRTTSFPKLSNCRLTVALQDCEHPTSTKMNKPPKVSLRFHIATRANELRSLYQKIHNANISGRDRYARMSANFKVLRRD